MAGLGHKIKDALTGHRHGHHGHRAHGTNLGNEDLPVAVGQVPGGTNMIPAEVVGYTTVPAETVQPTGYVETAQPVGMIEGERFETERLHHHHHHGVAAVAGSEVCNRREFAEVEDRPVIKERVERIVEHHPVEKRYAVETRAVGESELREGRAAESLGVTERVVDRVVPTATVPVSEGFVERAEGHQTYSEGYTGRTTY